MITSLQNISLSVSLAITSSSLVGITMEKGALFTSEIIPPLFFPFALLFSSLHVNPNDANNSIVCFRYN